MVELVGCFPELVGCFGLNLWGILARNSRGGELGLSTPLGIGMNVKVAVAQIPLLAQHQVANENISREGLASAGERCVRKVFRIVYWLTAS